MFSTATGEMLKSFAQSKQPRSIVVGGSFAGLSSAFSLSLRNHHVLVLDKRDEYTLTRKIFVSENMVKAFYGVSGLRELGVGIAQMEPCLRLSYPVDFLEPEVPSLDLEFFRLLEQKNCVIPTKTFQNYQLDKCFDMLSNRKFSYLSEDKIDGVEEEQAFSLDGQVDFLVSEVLAIDGKNQIIRIKCEGEEFSVPFDNLIAADGSNHEIADLLFAQNPEYTIPLGKLPHSRNNFYGVMRFNLTIPEADYDRCFPNRAYNLESEECKLVAQDFELLKSLGWEREYLPLIYLHVDREEKECYITGELPIRIDYANPEKIKNWLHKIAARVLKVEEGNLSLKEGPASFQVKRHYFKDNYAVLGQGGCFILMGDAWLPSNFLYGHGVDSAVEDGNVLFDCFDNKEGVFSSEPLERRKCVRLDEYYHCTFKAEEARANQLRVEEDKTDLSQLYLSPRTNYFDRMKIDCDEALNGQGRAPLTWIRKMEEERRIEEWKALQKMMDEKRVEEWKAQGKSLALVVCDSAPRNN